MPLRLFQYIATSTDYNLLYRLLKIYVRVAIRLFFHSIEVNKRDLLRMQGPLLIASNHPNSFLDAIVFDILFDMPVTSLARGDAFRNKQIFRLLRSLKMLPVYRIREGVENLNTNYHTFDTCIELFRQKEGVLIFSEGLCVNEWHLRPLKKGTSRLAFQAWKAHIPLTVLPAGINYSSFRKYGKKVVVQFGNFIEAADLKTAVTDGEKNVLFNKILKEQMEQLVFEIDPADKKELNKRFGTSAMITKILLSLPALAGALLHAPLYWLAKAIFRVFFKDTDHHDSVMLGILLLSYPLYLTGICWLSFQLLTPAWGIAASIMAPFAAWSYTRYDVRKG